MKYRPLIIKILIGLSALGLALSIYSLAHESGFVSGSFCTINTTFNCDVVNRGPFSKIDGVPVALLGVIAYAFFLAASCLKFREPHERTVSLFLLLGTAGGFLFSLYLSSIEEFILHTWCIVCLSSQFTVAALFGFSVWLFLGEHLESRAKQAEDIVKEAAGELKDLT